MPPLTRSDPDSRPESEAAKAPLFSEYKLGFILRRLLQTFCGGPRFWLPPEAPSMPVWHQFLLLILPCVLALPLLLCTTMNTGLRDDVASWIYGALIAIYVASVLALSRHLHNSQRRRVGSADDNHLPNVRVEITLLKEEDDDFVEIVTWQDSLRLIISPPSSLWVLSIRTILSGVTCGLAFYILQPGGSLLPLFQSSASSAVCFFGYISLALMQYSLTCHAPPELNKYNSVDGAYMEEFSRPLYALSLLILALLDRYFRWGIGAPVMIIFCILPLLFMVAILPTFQVLVAWILEQLLILVLGGTAKKSDGELLLAVFFGCIVAGLVAFLVSINQMTAAFILATMFGLVNGNDIESKLSLKFLSNEFWLFLRPSQNSFPQSFLWQFLLALAVAIVSVVSTPSQPLRPPDGSHSTSVDPRIGSIQNSIGITVAVIAVVLYCASEIQKRYIFLGIFRNALISVPDETGGSPKHNSALVQLFAKYLFRYLHGIVGPLLCIAFLGLEIGRTASDNSDDNQRDPNYVISSSNMAPPPIITAVLMYRSCRIIWQSTWTAHFEILVAIMLNGIFPDQSWWNNQSLYLRLAIIGFVIDRCIRFYNNMAYVFLATYSFLTNKRLRHPDSAKFVFILNVMLFPILVGTVMGASLLAAPVIPIFGIPFFIIGYPRPLRLWPSSAQVFSGSSDSTLYAQMEPSIREQFCEVMLNGSLGQVQAGSMYLLRLESRIVWIQVLERAHSNAIIVLKGLELQTTSCHAVEATILDEIFMEAFEHESQNKLINPYFGHVMTATLIFDIDCYSETKNILTGLIDSPDNLKLMTPTFFKTLVWLCECEISSDMISRIRTDDIQFNEEMVKKFPMNWLSYLRNKHLENEENLGEDPLVLIMHGCFQLFLNCTGSSWSSAMLFQLYAKGIELSKPPTWYSKNPFLHEICLRAIRYSFKVVYDQAILGEIDSFDELKDILTECKENWFISTEDDSNWGKSILSGVPSLFALGVLQESSSSFSKVYTGKMMQKRRLISFLGQLNAAAVQSMWAGLSLELLYFTNDDDERYSIQAHGYLLRNLAIQSADMLGYPVYASGPVAIELASASS